MQQLTNLMTLDTVARGASYRLARTSSALQVSKWRGVFAGNFDEPPDWLEVIEGTQLDRRKAQRLEISGMPIPPTWTPWDPLRLGC